MMEMDGGKIKNKKKIKQSPASPEGGRRKRRQSEENERADLHIRSFFRCRLVHTVNNIFILKIKKNVYFLFFSCPVSLSPRHFFSENQ